MSGKPGGHDGIRAERRTRGLPKRFVLRVTATAQLGRTEAESDEQRRVVALVMGEFAERLAAEGIAIEFVVGHPRSPDEIRATLRALANGGELVEDEHEATAAA